MDMIKEMTTINKYRDTISAAEEISSKGSDDMSETFEPVQLLQLTDFVILEREVIL